MAEMPARDDLPARSATARTILLLAVMASIMIGSAYYVFIAVSTHIGHRFDPADLFVSSAAGAVGVVTATLATVVAAAAMRRRAERQGRPTPIVAGEANGAFDALLARVDEIAATLGVGGRFLLRTAHLDSRVAAHVRWGRDRRPLVVLSGGLLHAHATEPAMVDAILAHELAHVRNRDVVPTTIAIAAWRATVVLGILPTAWILAVESSDWSRRVSALLLVGVVYLVRLDVLRSREFWADVRAGEAGFRPGLIEVLTRPPRGPRARSLFHPARKARIATLSTPNLSVRVLGLGEALLAGLAIGVVLPSHATFWRNGLPPLVGDVPTALASDYLALLPVMPFLLVIARAASSTRARWSTVQGAATLLALAVGVTLGSGVGLGLNSSGDFADSIPWIGITPTDTIAGWAPLIGLGAFLLIATLAIGWCRSVVALWSGPERPTPRVRIAVQISVVLFGALLFSSLQNVAALLLSENLGGWSSVDVVTLEGVEAAARAPWDVVPLWGREIDAGGFTGLFDYVDALVVGPIALAVPLLGALIRRRRPRRVLALFLAGALAVWVLDVALAVGILADIDTLAPPARAQLPQNVYDLQMFVETLAALLVAAWIGFSRRVPVVVAACTGATLATVALAIRMAARPVQCLLTPASTGLCKPGWSPQTIAEVALFKIAPTLLCCVVAAVVGRLLSRLLPHGGTRSGGPPSSDDGPEPRDGPLTPADAASPRIPSPL